MSGKSLYILALTISTNAYFRASDPKATNSKLSLPIYNDEQTGHVREILGFKGKTVILVEGRKGGDLESWPPWLPF